MRHNRTSRIGACVAAVAFAFAFTLSLAPQWHERFHPNASAPNHECAVTLVAGGSCHHAAPPTVVAPQSDEPIAKLSNLTSAFVASSFLSASIFEHAPPVLS